MNYVIEFIKAYWKWILIGLYCIILLLVNIFRKRVKVVDSVKEIILTVLPRFISSVEHPGDGPDKLQSVIDCVCAYLCRLFPDLDFTRYIPFIVDSVENILKCPQKKGVTKNER